MSGNDISALAVLLVLAIWFGWLLRSHAPRTWPWSLLVLVPAALPVGAMAIDNGSPVYLWRFVTPSEPLLPLVVLLVAGLVAVVLRARGRSWASALWVAASLVLIGLATLPSQSGTPRLSEDPAGKLWECVSNHYRWLPPGLSDVGPSELSAETLPNVALFVPLGVGIALVAKRSAWGRVVAAAVLSIGIEVYQALFTARVCSPVDVMANTLGAVLGCAVGLLAVTLPVMLARRRQRGDSVGPAPAEVDPAPIEVDPATPGDRGR